MGERKIPWKQALWSFGVEVAGSVLVSIGLNNFAIAAQLPLTGFSGMAFLMNYFLSIPIGWSIILLNIPVSLLCFRVLGRGFFLRSIRCTIISSLMIDYLAPLLPSYTGDRMLAAITTGVLCGLGYGMIYTQNTSTGGTDFITMSIKAKRPHLPVGKISLTMDVMVIIAESIVLQDADGLIYGLLCSFLLSTVVDQTIFGVNSGKLALVVTEHGEMIADLIDDTVQRGSTILTGRGGYQKTDKHVVMCACNTKQMVELRRAVRKADPEAFTIILDSNEVHGTGFRTVQFGDNPDGLPKPPDPTV